MKEINQLAIVDMIAIDRDEKGMFIAYYQILNPPSIEARRSGPSRAAVYTYEVSAPTMGNMLEKTGAVMSRNLYTSHLQCYVVSERMARAGLLKMANYLENYKERRTNVYAIVSEDPVSKVINTFTLLDRVPGRNIRLLLDWHARRLGINKLPTRMNDLVEGIPFSRPTIMPIIQYKGNGSASLADRLEDINATKQSITFNGGAVFIKAKMVGKVSDEIKNTYYVLNGYATRKQETFKVNGETVDIALNDIQIKRKWITKDRLQIRVDGNIGIINNEQGVKLTLQNIEKMELEFNRTYKKKCEQFVSFAKQKNWDMLGIGDTDHGRKRWKDIQVEFEVHSKLTTLGNTITPYE
ncbi:Ger(x)C family germination protein [Paenibacillus endophyticus]|uniref:Ger(X)C family germination protein n=2 Tax=Paenibacillus endophyticus TaxID=1294268 RepID=A0A7W5GBV3_9BACL|nr:Ger(x)C family germination protein [Paenibacillus endophyticus]